MKTAATLYHQLTGQMEQLGILLQRTVLDPDLQAARDVCVAHLRAEIKSATAELQKLVPGYVEK